MLCKVYDVLCSSSFKNVHTFTRHFIHAFRSDTHRGVLALHAGAVEAEGGDSLLCPLDGEHTLVATLTRLWLGQVLGTQGDGLHHVHRHQDAISGKQLGTFLQEEGRLLEQELIHIIYSIGYRYQIKFNVSGFFFFSLNTFCNKFNL